MIGKIAYLLLGVVILFVPGFLLSFLVFPKKGSLDFWKRIATSIGLSALLDMLIITILAQPKLKALEFTPVVGSILIFCVACGAVIFLRNETRQPFLNFFKKPETEK